MTRRARRVAQAALASSLLVGGVAVAVFFPRTAARYVPKGPVEGITADLHRVLPADPPPVVFTETAKAAGIDFRHFSGTRSTQLPEDMGSGAAWGDYDGDGDEDLFLVNIRGPLSLGTAEIAASPAASRLYRNNGDGTFTDVARAAGLELRIVGMGAAWGDFDGDARLDLAVTSYEDLLLFRNQGDGTFRDVSRAAGVAAHRGFWTGASWADYDLDGDLDLYVCGYVRYELRTSDREKVSLQFQAEVPFTLNPSSYLPERNLLLRNNGRGIFTDIAMQAGVDNPAGRSMAAAWCDLDGDGWPDLYVANDVSDNALFRNLGNGRFEEISHAAWVADYRGAMGLGVGDWDNDGDFDLFVTHWIAQENALYHNLRIAYRGAAPGRLTFMDVADQYGLGQSSLEYVKWGTSFFDYDNDGRADLFVANGSTFQDPADRSRLIAMRHQLFWNRGDREGFFETASASGDIFRQQSVGRGAAFADYDRDGDLDILVLNHGGPAWLLRNDGGNRQNWLQVAARGRKNRFAVGAVIRVYAGDTVQMQQIGAQPSYLSHNSLTAHFGLGSSSTADKVEVLFPGGGVVERLAVPANRVLVIEEPGT